MSAFNVDLENMLDVFADHTRPDFAAEAAAQARLMLEQDCYDPLEVLLEEKCSPQLEDRVWTNRAAAMMKLYLSEKDPDMRTRIAAHLEFTGYYSLSACVLFDDVEAYPHLAGAGRDMLSCIGQTRSRKGMVRYTLAAFSGRCPEGFDMQKAVDFLYDDQVMADFVFEAKQNLCSQALSQTIIENAKTALFQRFSSLR